MKKWHKLIILILCIILIALFIKWWMTYRPMEIVIINERNETVNISIVLLTMDKKEIYNKSFEIGKNESIVLNNITVWAGIYYLNVKINGEEKEKRIKYGKYYERIEVIIGKEIEIRNKRT